MTDAMVDTTVLVVEDEKPLADLYTHWLRDVADVRTAYDGEGALELVDDDVDVVLLDRRMPGLSGDDVLEEVQQRRLDPSVVMVTAVDPDFDIVDMRIDDYLVKPVSGEDLLDAVNRTLRRSEYDDKIQQSFRLIEKKATLEATKTPQELEASDEYARLERRLEEIQEDIDQTVDAFTETDFTAAFRDLPSGEPTDAPEQ